MDAINHSFIKINFIMIVLMIKKCYPLLGAVKQKSLEENGTIVEVE
jgi:hypothetical protein